MKPKALVTILSIALAACAATPDGRQAWDTRPVLDIRHGMADADAYFQFGRHEQERGNRAAAEALYGKALALNPEHADTLNALARLHAERGDLERAVAFFRKTAELEPQRAYLHNNVGYALYLQGRYGEAVDSLRRAVTLKPDYDRAWVNLQNAARKGRMPEVAALAARRSLGGDQAAVAGNAAKAPSVPLTAGRAPMAGEAVQPSLPVSAVASAGMAQPITMREVPARPVAVASPREAAQPSAMPSGMPAQAVPASLPAASASSPMAGVRIEVSNGNGINGFARLVRSRLQSDGVKVSRTTNYSSYKMQKTTIEYRDGYSGAAQALQAQLGKPAALAVAQANRPGTDVRLILGRDWTPRLNVISAELRLPLPSEGFSFQEEA